MLASVALAREKLVKNSQPRAPFFPPGKSRSPCSQYLVPSSFLRMQACENAYEVLSNTERVGEEGKGENNANRWSNLVSFLLVKQGLCSRYDLFF